MNDTCPLEIPSDLGRWHPNEITGWLSTVEDDETISDADFDRARQAVGDALGIG
ncbi:hypothetical protein OG949_40390 (plasmid) [Streptomyces scopuliridis]|uniref:hypothetical protein n=1 Tax=Streptomyces scopuliridis TaxID=452529 RepID=UPI002DDA8B72|nr:hypothetical protein [Streptomyces scopuliridis]WSB39017.1 hypothetical protein OG949_40390 [Streptomyces scopuliridis]